MGGNRLPSIHAPFSGGAVVMRRTAVLVCFVAVGVGVEFWVLVWRGTVLPLGLVLMICVVYIVNGTQRLNKINSDFDVYGT